MQGRRNPERRRLEPVVVKNVKAGDSLLEEYVVIFAVISGPLTFMMSGRYLVLYYPSLLWMVWMKQSNSSMNGES